MIRLRAWAGVVPTRRIGRQHRRKTRLTTLLVAAGLLSACVSIDTGDEEAQVSLSDTEQEGARVPDAGTTESTENTVSTSAPTTVSSDDTDGASANIAAPESDQVNDELETNEDAVDNQTATPSNSSAFTEAFDDPASLDRFQWQLHHGVSYGQETFTWQGDHDDGCGKPTTTRTIEVSPDIVLFPDGMDDLDRYGNFVYWCAPGGDGTGHLMTSFNTEGYAQIAFAPSTSFIDVHTVCWDQNQTDLGERKWTQMVVVPEATYERNDQRLDYVSPVFFDGPGQGGVPVSDDVVLFEMVQGSTALSFGDATRFEIFDGFVNADKASRFRTCLTDTGTGTINIELERDGLTETRTFEGSFPQGPARVVFQDDSYNPPKAPGIVEHPFTWHWDNILIETE